MSLPLTLQTAVQPSPAPSVGTPTLPGQPVVSAPLTLKAPPLLGPDGQSSWEPAGARGRAHAYGRVRQASASSAPASASGLKAPPLLAASGQSSFEPAPAKQAPLALEAPPLGE